MLTLECGFSVLVSKNLYVLRISYLNIDADFISLILSLDKEFSFPGSFN